MACESNLWKADRAYHACGNKQRYDHRNHGVWDQDHRYSQSYQVKQNKFNFHNSRFKEIFTIYNPVIFSIIFLVSSL